MQGFQKKYLRGVAHNMKPVVLIGQKGLSETLLQAIDKELDQHELIKIKFNDFKDKEEKKTIILAIEEQTVSEVAGMIGHTAILYRCHKDPEKRKIRLPMR